MFSMDYKSEGKRKQRHSLNLLDQIKSMKDLSEMIDMVLVAEGEKFPCHKLMLSAFSPYFKAMFTCGLVECTQKEVVLQDMSAESVSILLQYMYTAELHLTNSNVQGVATTAFFMQMDDVSSMCQAYMMEHMDASNCVGIHYFAKHIGAEELSDQARRYLYLHFAEVSLHEEILEVEMQQLLNLIRSDDLNVSREESILDLVLRYNSRGNHSWQSLCTAEFRELYALGTIHNDLYITGGQMKLKNQYHITNCVGKYSMEQENWRALAPLPVPLACHAAVTVKNRLYVMGGWTPQMDLPDDEPDRLSNRMLRYDPGQDKWTECTPMKYSKYRFSTAVVNNEIYVLGGIGCLGRDRGQSRQCLDAVEIYNPERNFWRDGPPMPYPLLSLRTNSTSAGAVERKLYVCGGFRGAARHEVITKEILELDTWENQWNVVAVNVLMHDSYDVCLVAQLNPRDLIPPPPDLVE
nr:kelch repeat and BTB domain-containing protein 12 isoform X5 [Zootoca vivipara]